MEFVPRQRRCSLDSQVSLELGAKQRRESLDSSEISNQWRQFLQRNRDFASNKERALDNKRKVKQDELDKACTFAPKVHEWNLKVDDCDRETESSVRPGSTTSTSGSEVALSKMESDFLGASQRDIDISVNESQDVVDGQVSSFRLQGDSDEVPATTADCFDNGTVAVDANGLSCVHTATEPTVDDNQSHDLDQYPVSETLLTSKLPLEAWKEAELLAVSQGDGGAIVDCKQGPAKLSSSPSGKLVISNLASEAKLHDAWPRAKLLFTDCDDLCEKKLSTESATASTEVSNCPSESGGLDNDDDDLDTFVAHLRSHKVYSFHFSG